MSEKKNILVIKLGALGDFIQACGAMRAIRKHHKNDKVTLLTTPPFVNLGEKCGYFDEIRTDVRPKWNEPLKWLELRRTLNASNYSRVYDLQNNDRTSIYFRLFKRPKPEWVGIARGASHRNTSPKRTAGLAFDGHVQTLGLAGVTGVELDRLEWMDCDVSRFGIEEPYALIVPGSAPSRPEKRWPVDSYIGLCEYLVGKEIVPVIIGTKDEQEITDMIDARCCGVKNLARKTSIFDIATLARGAKVAIGNDTGPMHIIAPTGCRTVVIFSGSSNPVRHSPKGEDVRTIQKEDIRDIEVGEIVEMLGL